MTPVLGKGSGLDSIVIALDRLNLNANEAELAELLSRVKARSLEAKSLVTIDEFSAMAEDVLGARVN